MKSSTIHLVVTAIVFTVIGAFGHYAISPLFNPLVANEPVPGTAATTMTTEAVNTNSAAIVDTPAHPATGTVRIISADGKNYVRYENLKSINGPAIHVYLANDLDAKDFVDLGPVTATEGNVNYEIPEGVDPSKYMYVLTWCKQFGVLFNSAKIN